MKLVIRLLVRFFHLLQPHFRKVDQGISPLHAVVQMPQQRSELVGSSRRPSTERLPKAALSFWTPSTALKATGPFCRQLNSSRYPTSSNSFLLFRILGYYWAFALSSLPGVPAGTRSGALLELLGSSTAWCTVLPLQQLHSSGTELVKQAVTARQSSVT